MIVPASRELEGHSHGAQQLRRNTALSKEAPVSGFLGTSVFDVVVERAQVRLERGLSVVEGEAMLHLRVIHSNATLAPQKLLGQI